MTTDNADRMYELLYAVPKGQAGVINLIEGARLHFREGHHEMAKESLNLAHALMAKISGQRRFDTKREV